jgi:hypothetical protein
MTDPAEALPACGNLGFEHGRDALTQPEIRSTHDAGGSAQIAIPAAGAFRSDALHKLRFADNPELLRPIGTIHRSAFNEHRLTHVVSLGVRHEMLEKVPLRRAVGYIP